MKTPDGKDMNILSETLEKVKKGIGCCSKNVLDPCIGCPYERTENAEWKCGLNADVLALIQQLEAQVPKWISCKEELPQEAGSYLVRCIHWYSDNDGYECYKVACFDPKVLWINLGNLLKVTHWMPLPEPPKEE